jgi:NADPH:quinone reductase
MKAVTVEAFGGPEHLRFGSAPDPVPAKGEVVVAVKSAGVGFVDVMAREGRYVFPKPGFILGMEIVGEVATLGEGVDASFAYRSVLALLRGGGYAERVVVKARNLIPLPEGISSEQALAIGVNGLVAAFALDRARVETGERVLVRGAGGGIGLWVTQLAAQLTSDVTATTSSEARGKRLAELGATAVWNRRADPPLDAGSFDVIIDAVGGPDLPSYIGNLRPNGRYVLCGGLGGPPPTDFGMALMTQFHHSLSIAMLSLNSIASEALSRRLEPLLQALARGEISAPIDSRFPLEAAAAHRRLETGEAFGKILLTI